MNVLDETQDEHVRAAIERRPGVYMYHLMDECCMKGNETPRVRALDHTLQRLRRRGEIKFSRKNGWRVTKLG